MKVMDKFVIHSNILSYKIFLIGKKAGWYVLYCIKKYQR